MYCYFFNPYCILYTIFLFNSPGRNLSLSLPAGLAQVSHTTRPVGRGRGGCRLVSAVFCFYQFYLIIHLISLFLIFFLTLGLPLFFLLLALHDYLYNRECCDISFYFYSTFLSTLRLPLV